MSKKTILYVDDEEDMRILVSTVLEEQGYRVLTAEDAPKGLNLVFSEFPDLIITDVMMPGESGFSLCEKVKADPSTKDIPVVFLSVMDEEGTGMQLGAAAFLGKPFDVDQLRETVDGILHSSDSRQVLESALEALRENRLEDSLKGFKDVIEMDPGSAPAEWARYYAAQILHKNGETGRAEEELQGLLKDNPGFWRAHNRLALMSLQDGDYRKAIQHFDRSLALNENQPDVKEKVAQIRKEYLPSEVPDQ